MQHSVVSRGFSPASRSVSVREQKGYTAWHRSKNQMDGLGDGYEAFVERLQSDFAAPSAAKSSGTISNSNVAAHPPHPSQLQRHQSRYVGYPSPTHAFTVKRETSPSVSESSTRTRDTFPVDVPMQDVTSPGPSTASGPGRLPTPAHNFSNDVNRMPDTPPRQRGHRRAQSEIAFRLPEDVSFERELGFHCSEMPALSDDTEDLFSMYIDMEQINSFSATSGVSGTKASGDRGIVSLVPSYHSTSPSVDGVPAVSNGGRSGSAVASGSSIASDVRRARHQHSNSMDGSTSFKHDLLAGEFDGVDVKKVMSSDKLADIALIDPKRAKRILANRQSAARSKERKMRYISELERKVQTLQTEATTLSAQLTMLQKDSSGLTTENSKLKLRLQSMEQQAQLQDALNDALREEVQRLKVATGHLTNSSGQNLGGQHFYHLSNQQINSQQLQQVQQAQTGLDNQQEIQSEILQHDTRSLSSNFLKSGGPHNAGNHTSSASF